MKIQHNFIAIEGNIGAGKTTLCKMIQRDFNCQLILEQFTDNPFLPFFYEDPERYAFQVELFFMSERHKQLQTELGQNELFSDFKISDYYFIKTLLFASNNLKGEEYRLFARLFNVLNTTFPEPDLLVYLYRSVDNLLANIQHRGRAYEQNIKASYLEDIQKAYLQYFRGNPHIPILIIDIENSQFWNKEEEYKGILSLINQTYSKGIHSLSLEEEIKKGAINR